MNVHLLLALALALLLAGCPKAPPPGAAGPVEAAQAFATALQKRDPDAAWALLSSRTQARADALAAKAAGSGAGAQAGGGQQMLFSGALPGAALTARVLSEDGGAAELELTEAGRQPHKGRAVREGGGWKIDLDLPSE
jgi:hypothetical protein